MYKTSLALGLIGFALLFIFYTNDPNMPGITIVGIFIGSLVLVVLGFIVDPEKEQMEEDAAK